MPTTHSHHRRPSLFTRMRRSVSREFRRIRDEHRSSGKRRRRPPLASRIRHWFRDLRQTGFRPARHRPAKRRIPPVSKRINYFLSSLWEKYRVVFTPKYLVITLNSTVIFLISFFIIHFLTHLVTGITAGFCEISTTLNYTMVDFHIRYWDWTPEMVIIVFTVPALFSVLVALLASRPFAKKGRRRKILHRLRYFTRKQRHRHNREQRKKEIDLQVQRLHHQEPVVVKTRRKTRFSWPVRLFFLWTMYHSLTYFFSGMLYSFLFHRRFGYVIWYAFNNFFFDVLFSVIAFLGMAGIGYFYASQFFYSGKMYFNHLNEKNRMPFVVSQTLFPFIIGTIVTIAMQAPVFDPSLVLLNFSLFFLLLPIPSRSSGMTSIRFDATEKPVKIFWNWIILSAIIVISILIAVKIGIPIHIH